VRVGVAQPRLRAVAVLERQRLHRQPVQQGVPDRV
jgi:hypothetical protein